MMGQKAQTQPPMGLIAGAGSLPLEIARSLRKNGRQVACVGLLEQYDPQLPEYCDYFKTAGIIQIGKWIRYLNRFGASEAQLVGRVGKVRMYDPFVLFRQIPDWRAARVWFFTTRHDKRTDHLLGAVADELAAGGITLIDTTRNIPHLMADEGVMTRTQPTQAQMADIQFGLPIVAAMGGLDIGQSIAVKDREVIAVEAIEGTDRMIDRAGNLCKAGRWSLLKVAKPNQDMRFDVPTVGLQTLEKLKDAGAGCLALEAGSVILLDKPKMIELADKMGIAMIGVRKPDVPTIRHD